MSISKKIILSLERRILYEEANLLVINKPAGLSVHKNGTNKKQHSDGLIEALRIMRPTVRFLELVHRLDRETSGCLMLAKKRATLVALHALLKKRKVKKQYFLLVKGPWKEGICHVQAPLKKYWLQDQKNSKS